MPFFDIPVQAGEANYRRVPMGDLPDGTPVEVPVVTIGGVHDGPTLYLQGAIHGDELTGVEVCRQAIASIDPARLSGRVIAVPVANVPAHITRTRGYVLEERWPIDLNRYWPGDPHGLLTERIAHGLFNEIIVHADFTIDLHAALDGCEIAPFVYIWPDDDDNGSLKFRESQAHAFAPPYIYRHARAARFGTSTVQQTLSLQGDDAGTPVMLAESGESRRVSTQFVPVGVRGIRNVMINMGMLEGELDRPEEPREFTHFEIVHTNRGGGLRLTADLRDEVTTGQKLGEVVDIFGRVVEDLQSPCDGFVLRVMRLGNVGTGAEAFWIGH